MKMRIYKKIVVVLTLFFTVGCTDLIDLAPEDTLTYESFFQSERDAEALLNSLESSMKNVAWDAHDMIGCIADNITNSWYVNLRNLAGYTNNWTLMYNKTLSYADMIIENVSRFPEPEKMQPYVLQAYFAKGLTYFQLAKFWGEVPIKRGATYDLEKLPKSTIPEVLEVATDYALKALDLPKFEELKDYTGTARPQKQYGSKGAAAALLAHLYAWRAAIEEKPEYWAEAEKYCTMIIEGETGYYELATDPEKVCTEVMLRNSGESIFEFSNDRSVNRFFQNTSLYQSIDYVGFPIMSESYKMPNTSYTFEIYKTTVNDMFEKSDKRRDAYFGGIDADYFYVVRDTLTNVVKQCYSIDDGLETKYFLYDRDGHATVQMKQLLEKNERIDSRYANGSIKKALVAKFRYPFYVKYDWSPTESFVMMDQARIHWRLADIILLRAECRVRKTNPDRNGAIEDLNSIRQRAYGNNSRDYPCADDQARGLASDLQKAIFREREKELMFEGHRYYDVVRNGWDYVRTELPPAFATLTDQDIHDGALYLIVGQQAFDNNDLMRQNVYWDRKNN